MSKVMVSIDPEPYKLHETQKVSLDNLLEYAEKIKQAVVDVPEDRPISCIDERTRKGVVSGEPAEPRYSVPGGSNVYGLDIAEMTGQFADELGLPATGRLSVVTNQLKKARIPSGKHLSCAADELFFGIQQNIGGENFKVYRDFAAEKLGDDFDPGMAMAVHENARATVGGKKYNKWNGTEVYTYLGPAAPYSTEKLDDIPHTGIMWVDNELEGKTVDQNMVYQLTGQFAFVFDTPVAEKIERAVVGDDPQALLLAKHARLILCAAIREALPNEEIHGLRVAA